MIFTTDGQTNTAMDNTAVALQAMQTRCKKCNPVFADSVDVIGYINQLQDRSKSLAC